MAKTRENVSAESIREFLKELDFTNTFSVIDGCMEPIDYDVLENVRAQISSMLKKKRKRECPKNFEEVFFQYFDHHGKYLMINFTDTTFDIIQLTSGTPKLITDSTHDLDSLWIDFLRRNKLTT